MRKTWSNKREQKINKLLFPPMTNKGEFFPWVWHGRLPRDRTDPLIKSQVPHPVVTCETAWAFTTPLLQFQATAMNPQASAFQTGNVHSRSVIASLSSDQWEWQSNPSASESRITGSRSHLIHYRPNQWLSLGIAYNPTAYHELFKGYTSSHAFK